MKKNGYFFNLVLWMVLFMCTSKINAQYTYGTNIAQPNSIVTIQSIDSARGLKLPAVTKAKLTALPVTASMNGLIVYDITDSCYKICNGVYWDCITQDTNAHWMMIGQPPMTGHKSALLKGTPDTLIITDNGQLAFGTTKPNANSLADFHSVDSTKGIVIPRIPISKRPLASVSLGMIIYNVDDSCMQISDGLSWKCLGEPLQNTPCVPAGFVMSYSSNTSPGSEWLLCDGSAVSRTTYDDLFAAVGTIYGTGDGSTTFNLPDYRGYFMRGTDHGAGNDPDALARTDRGDGTTGDNVGTIQLDELDQHLHSVDPPSTATSANGNHNHSSGLGHNNGAVYSYGSSAGSNNNVGDWGSVYDGATGGHANTSTAGNHTHTVNISVFNSGGTGGNETRPKNINVDYYISSGQGCSTHTIDTIVIYDTVILDTSTSDDIGVIDAFPFATAPNGYLACEGQAVSRATYAQLFARLGTMYGPGDGATTFNLPDMRGQFIRGWDNGAGNDPDAATRTNRGDGTIGDNIGTMQGDEFASHTHDYERTNNQNAQYEATNTETGNRGVNTSTSNATGGSETRPKNIYMMYCIKYK